jgi:hypothetical protein
MMTKRVVLAIVGVLLLLQLFAPAVSAQVPERGLLITPPRQYLEVEPGKAVKSSVTVANLTEKPLDIQLGIEQFSVVDYTYAYNFTPPKEDWVKFELSELTLQKTESRTVSYTVTAPANARPGGHYFTLLASTSLGEGKKVRAATVLYVTAGGEVTKNSSVESASVPFFSFGGDIPIRLNVRNTGNTHFFAYVSGEVQHLVPLPSVKSGEVAHILLPDTIRTIEEKTPAPAWPGLYKIAYGYREEDGHAVYREQLILILQPWAIALLAGLGWLGIILYRRRKRLKTTGS